MTIRRRIVEDSAKRVRRNPNKIARQVGRRALLRILRNAQRRGAGIDAANQWRWVYQEATDPYYMTSRPKRRRTMMTLAREEARRVALSWRTRWPVCGLCGECAGLIENPCGNPCNAVPF